MKKTISFFLGFIVATALIFSGAIMEHEGMLNFFNPVMEDIGIKKSDIDHTTQKQTNKILNEESAVIDVAEQASPSVVTVSIKKTEKFIKNGRPFGFDPFMDPFGSLFERPQIGERQVEHDIGSGFIVSADGLIVTNKHVVSDTDAEYKVITNDDKEYKVTKIDRDPLNDLAILKIEASDLKPLELGDSDNLKVGQFAIAIGTALGEFRHTVTTGVISGLGRGITAGDSFSMSAEELDNVIQTDAAINPGNSGGPLLNSAGQVIGVNVAIASNGENIGFALPINIIKTALNKFEKRGGFKTRAFLGVRYFMISQEAALQNEVPQGAYIQEVVEGSPAEKAGIQPGDIITKIDDQSLKDVEGGLAGLIADHKGGDKISIEYYRDGEKNHLQLKLDSAK